MSSLLPHYKYWPDGILYWVKLKVLEIKAVCLLEVWIMHQLIILGNGFDLTCGLKSKFSDFYRNRTSGTFSIESIPEDVRNVWDLVLSEIGQNDPLWCDIESLISIYVFQEDGYGSRLDRMFSITGLSIDPSNPNQPLRPKDDLYEFVSTRLKKEVVSQEELTGFLLSSQKNMSASLRAISKSKSMKMNHIEKWLMRISRPSAMTVLKTPSN